MDTADIEDQACAWLIREDGEDWTQSDMAARDIWLAQSTANRVVYLRLKSVWDRTQRLAALRAEPAAWKREGDARPASWLNIAAGFALFVVIGAVGIVWVSQQRDLYRTPIGAHETIHLADGTAVELNTDTELRTVVTPQRREVILDHGEAYFQVVHNPAKPFVVLAGSKRITDLGTKFSVRRNGDHVQVIVTQGRVRIEDRDRPSMAPAVLVKSDMQVSASAQGTLVATRTPAQIAMALSWRQGLLIFNQETLAGAAAEFNRYNQKKLVINGDSLARTRIGGSFEAANVEAFARLLRDGFGFKIEETDDEVRISL